MSIVLNEAAFRGGLFLYPNRQATRTANVTLTDKF